MRGSISLTIALAIAPAACSQPAGTLDAARARSAPTRCDRSPFSGSGRWYQFGQSPSAELPWPAFDVSSYTATIDYETPSARVQMVRMQVVEPGRVRPAPVEQRVGSVRQRHVRVESARCPRRRAGGRRRRRAAARGRRGTRDGDLDHAARVSQGRGRQQRHVRAGRRRIEGDASRRRQASLRRHDQRAEPGHACRDVDRQPGARRHACRVHLFGLPRLRRRELPRTHRPRAGRPSRARDHRVGGHGQCARVVPRSRGGRQRRCRLPVDGHGRTARAGRPLHPRRQPSQRRHRPAGSHRRRRSTTERGAIAGRRSRRSRRPFPTSRFAIWSTRTTTSITRAGCAPTWTRARPSSRIRPIDRTTSGRGRRRGRSASDRLAQSKKPAQFETVGDAHTLTDGKRTIQIHRLAGNGHNDGFLIVYLPAEKILVEVDAWAPTAANVPPPAVPSPFAVNLYDNIQRLKLDVAQIAALHGPRVATFAEFAAAVRPAATSTR